MNKEKLKGFLHFAPVNTLWQWAKVVYIYGHKSVTAAKAAIFFIVWNGRIRKKLDRMLPKGTENIRPFRPLRWKHKVCYFTGVTSGRKVFIKTGGKVNTTDREVFALTYAAEHSKLLKKHIPIVVSATPEYLMEEMIDGKPLFPDESFVRQLHMIYRELKRCEIRHLDIRPDNFIVKQDGTLILIDFGYALVNTTDIYDRIEHSKTSSSIIERVGSNYSPRNGTVDDAYSMLLTMKYVCPFLLKKYPDIWRELNLDIGKRAIYLEQL